MICLGGLEAYIAHRPADYVITALQRLYHSSTIAYI